jgi:hypothetical protein
MCRLSSSARFSIGLTDVTWVAAGSRALNKISLRFELFRCAQPSLPNGRVAGPLGEIAIPGSELAEL